MLIQSKISYICTRITCMCMKNHDQLLVEELKNGKERTLKSFYEEYFALFVSFANNLLPSEEECKDVVHDVFLKYWNTLVWVFVARFLIEFVKERQVPFEDQMILDVGQVLSIPFILLGIFLLICGFKCKKNTTR